MSVVLRNGQVGDWRLSDDDFHTAFRLPTARDKTEVLKERHPLARDCRISFEEESHTYTVDGVAVPLSVTGLIHRYSRGFDATEAIRVMRPETRQNYTDRGLVTESEITESWTRNGAVQSARGTLMHFQIEQYINRCQIEEPWSPEFQQFVTLFNGISDQQPFRTELSIFSSRYNIAGQIDGLFKHENGTFVVWDWKRCKNLRYDSHTQMLEPLSHLPDTNYFHYALQLNIYRHILETEYDMRVYGMYLGVFHPNRSEPMCVRIPAMDEELRLILEQHAQ